MQQHIGGRQQVRELFFLHAVDLLLQRLVIGHALYVFVFYVIERAGEEAAGAAGRVHNRLAELRINAIDHKAGDGAWGIKLTGIARRLQIFEDLFVNVAEQVALAGAGEVDFVELVDHLTQQGAVFHVVIGIAERLSDHKAARVLIDRRGEVFQRREQVVVDELQQGITGNAFGVRRPGAPQVALRNRVLVVILLQFQRLFLGVKDFQKQQPGELAEALRIAVHAGVFAHNVL